ncbi:polyhydroxyalkanoate synthesis repressor PhaR [Paracraurococcus ruber]|uniref:Polyhydroxyalkanoate synthesis repressor PhaR n=1 Tax=Paracraurococcus ruber TaxID=77675 RepID=A0ABS1CY95_9PROT|nr:polyhydroxyalkanoate synthesis repressor PhaR [Paracraurococcus ruber]MBK1659383.1 polyhydroxyalkanoate synthesis repressor PhaR [Paracraurococcus ruber]TDG27110.1 polyhydroxyalkanoate synthesis repressor PhaR [Paracraurococcus ruber]
MAENAARAESAPETPAQPVVVKKYANRRLYNTESSSYVTLEDLAGMVRQGRDFIVFDAKSGEDITRSVLTQIIVEEESKGRNLLPESFLRHLIGFYGDSLQSVLPRYLEHAMAGFAKQQEQMRRSVEQAMGGFMPFGGLPALEEMGKQNMAMLERAMSLFAPFRAPDSSQPQTVEQLRAEVESLRRQLAEAQRTDKSSSRTA